MRIQVSSLRRAWYVLSSTLLLASSNMLAISTDALHKIQYGSQFYSTTKTATCSADPALGAKAGAFFVGDSLTLHMTKHGGLLDKAKAAGYTVDTTYTETAEPGGGVKPRVQGPSVDASGGITIAGTSAWIGSNAAGLAAAGIVVIGLGTNGRAETGKGSAATDAEVATAQAAAIPGLIAKIRSYTSAKIFWVNTYFTDTSYGNYQTINQTLLQASATNNFNMIDIASAIGSGSLLAPDSGDGVHYTTTGNQPRAAYVVNQIGTPISAVTGPVAGAGTGNSTIYALGDSLTVGMRDTGGLQTKLEAKGWKVAKINAIGGKALRWGIEQLQADQQLIKDNNVGTFLIGLGTNNLGDSVNGLANVESWMQQIIDTASAANPSIKPRFFWTDFYGHGTYNGYNMDSGYVSLNGVLQKIASRNSVSIIPWSSSAIAKQYVSTNDLHPYGHYSEMAALVTDTIGVFGQNGGSGPTQPRSGCGCPTLASGSGNSVILYNFLLGKGLTSLQAAAVVGVVQGESINVIDKETWDVNGPSAGFAQWHDKEGTAGRLTGLKNFAAAAGKPWQDMGVQMDFFWFELTGSYKKSVYDVLSTTSDMSVAVTVMVSKYEIPGDIPGQITKRLGLANAFYATVSGAAPAGPAAPSAPAATTACGGQPATGDAAKYISDCSANGGNAHIACTAINQLSGYTYPPDGKSSSPATSASPTYLDCSGLTNMAVYRTFGVNPGACSVGYLNNQYFQTIDVHDIQVGDMVGIGAVCTGNGGNGHIAIVVSYDAAAKKLITVEASGGTYPSGVRDKTAGTYNVGLLADGFKSHPYEWAVRYIGPKTLKAGAN